MRRQRIDLVQEQAAAVGVFDQPRFAAARVGEGAAAVAEQLRFEQGVGQRAASSLPVPVSPSISTGALQPA
jgi:hypothetical protein